jgi:hypothetical protein
MKRNHAHPTLSVAFLRPKQKDAEKIHEKEIEDSIARSHAARVTHKRRAEALHRSFAFQGGSYGQPNDCKPPLLSEPRGLHRHDPFATYAGHDAPTFVFQALDYGLSSLYGLYYNADIRSSGNGFRPDMGTFSTRRDIFCAKFLEAGLNPAPTYLPCRGG